LNDRGGLFVLHRLIDELGNAIKNRVKLENLVVAGNH